MENKIYETTDDYQQAANDLLDFIKERDILAASLKIVPAHRLREGQELLAAMDKKIEACEAALAAEYEAYQNKCRSEEKLAVTMDDIKETMATAYIHLKYNHPEKYEELLASLFNSLPPEEKQDFCDRMTRLEATQLRELVAQVGDTEADIDRKIKLVNAKSDQNI